MDLTVIKTVDEFGRVTLQIGEYNLSKNHYVVPSVSRYITGTTNENIHGIFTNENKEVFYYGEYSREFILSDKWSSEDFNLSAQEIVNKLKAISLPIIEWVNECKKLARIETATVSIDPVSEIPLVRLIRLGNKAKDNGKDYAIANVCFALAAQIMPDMAYETNGKTYYDLAVIRHGTESLCIPVPLLTREWAIRFARDGEKISRGSHNREVDMYDVSIMDRHVIHVYHIEELKRMDIDLTSIGEVLENIPVEFEAVEDEPPIRKRRVVHKNN